MEENSNLLETLLERASEYGKTSIDLAKLKALDKTYYGFLIVAAFYVIAGILIHFFLRKWIKRLVGDYFIKRVLK